MWRNIILSAMVVFIGATVAKADLILTVDSQNPTGIPLMLVGTGSYQIALDGNTTIEPNDVRFEAVGGTLTVISDVNHQYSFQYDTGSTAGFVWLITNVDMTIDDINIPANTTIYQIFIFCNLDVNITGVCGSDYSMLYPPEDDEESQGYSIIEQPQEQTMVMEETNESLDYGTNYGLTISSISLAFDLPEPNIPNLNNDGIVNFIDFSLFANTWLLTGEGLAGDFDRNNSVDYNDLYSLSYYWLEGPPPKTEFEQFKAALAIRDINTALTYMSEISKDKYAYIFQIMEPNLPDLAGGMGGLIFNSQEGRESKYEMKHQDGMTTYLFPVIFIQDENGNWKIYNF